MASSLRPSQRVVSCLLAHAAPRFSPAAPAARQTLLRQRRAYSAEADAPAPAPAPGPPLLQKLKGDLKAAMRARDAPRLTVLRSVLSATVNASKTASPVTTDAQLVALLRKTRAASLEAIEEFTAAGRDDLADGERAQVAVLDEYVASSGFKEVSADELRVYVARAIDTLTAERRLSPERGARFGNVMNELLGPASPFTGKIVDKTQLAVIIKQFVD